MVERVMEPGPPVLPLNISSHLCPSFLDLLAELLDFWRDQVIFQFPTIQLYDSDYQSGVWLVSVSIVPRPMLDAVGAFRNEENVAPVITQKNNLPHIHETSKGSHIITLHVFLSMEELKQVILSFLQFLHSIILNVTDVASALSALSSGVACYIHSRTITCIIAAAKQGQIPYLHDILKKSQGKHCLGPKDDYLFFPP